MEFPKFKINTRAMQFGTIEDGIDDIVGFHENIVNHIEDNIDGVCHTGNVLCLMIDEEGNEYESVLDEDKYIKSLNKSLDFFKEIEQYEKCKRITDLLNRI